MTSVKVATNSELFERGKKAIYIMGLIISRTEYIMNNVRKKTKTSLIFGDLKRSRAVINRAK